jgi:riboflavin kinase/FMN adenylyltransferase
MSLLYHDTIKIPVEAQGGAVTIGNFDGVHRGHRAIMKQVRELADRIGGPAIVFTFDPPPACLLRPSEAPEALTSMERRAQLLHQFGIDHVIVYPTTLDLLQLEPEEFFAAIIVKSLHAKAIAEGENFRFGKRRRGDVTLLKQLCDQKGIEFSLLQLEQENGDWISSTRIRLEIEAGNMKAANQLLVEPYRISGIVAQGDQRGRTIGFPTANLQAIPMLCPPVGVYAARVAKFEAAQPGDNASNAAAVGNADPVGLPVALHIGPNPTFGVPGLKVEAHIVGFHGDLYGASLDIEILDRLRDVHRFASKEELVAQLTIDVEKTKAAVASIKLP